MRLRRTRASARGRVRFSVPHVERPPRVLILTAGVGEGHDGPARVLRGEIAREAPEAEVSVVDGLTAMGPVMSGVAEGGAAFMSHRAPVLLDLQYALFARLAPTRVLGQWIMVALGGRRLRRLLAATRPDVVVSTYPGVTEVLRRMRRMRLVRVPIVSAITDLSALRYWAGRGVDLHLVTHEESIAEVRRYAGRDTRVEWVRGLVDPAFARPPDVEDARRELDLPLEGPVVVVSGGGWGVGDLEGAVRAALDVPGVAAVVCACGRSEDTRAAVAARFATEPRVRVIGFTNRMSALLSAGDVLVHSSAGLTVLEGLLCGCRVISYGWGVAHIRLNNRAFRRFGLAWTARTPDQLRAMVARALAEPAPAPPRLADLPSAAALVLREAWVPAGDLRAARPAWRRRRDLRPSGRRVPPAPRPEPLEQLPPRDR